MWIPEGRDSSASCTAQLLFGISWLRGGTLKTVSRIGHGRQLMRVDGARVLRAESWGETGLLVSVEPSGLEKRVALYTDFCVSEVRKLVSTASGPEIGPCL